MFTKLTEDLLDLYVHATGESRDRFAMLLSCCCCSSSCGSFVARD